MTVVKVEYHVRVEAIAPSVSWYNALFGRKYTAVWEVLGGGRIAEFRFDNFSLVLDEWPEQMASVQTRLNNQNELHIHVSKSIIERVNASGFHKLHDDSFGQGRTQHVVVCDPDHNVLGPVSV